MVEAPFFVTFGWAKYLATVVPRVRWNPGVLLLAAICLTACTLLTHGLAKWLWQGNAARRWRWKWTLLALGGVLLTFVAGVAATGVVHQSGWLLRSPVPLVESNWDRRRLAMEVKCRSNLEQLYQMIVGYHSLRGKPPADIDDLAFAVASHGGHLADLVCPEERVASNHATTQAWLETFRQRKPWGSYIYVPGSLPSPDGTRRIILYESEQHHLTGKLHVLFEDGQVDALAPNEASDWLDTTASSRPTSGQ